MVSSVARFGVFSPDPWNFGEFSSSLAFELNIQRIGDFLNNPPGNAGGSTS